jgi:hypothetical protein
MSPTKKKKERKKLARKLSTNENTIILEGSKGIKDATSA